MKVHSAVSLVGCQENRATDLISRPGRYITQSNSIIEHNHCLIFLCILTLLPTCNPPHYLELFRLFASINFTPSFGVLTTCLSFLSQSLTKRIYLYLTKPQLIFFDSMSHAQRAIRVPCMSWLQPSSGERHIIGIGYRAAKIFCSCQLK